MAIGGSSSSKRKSSFSHKKIKSSKISLEVRRKKRSKKREKSKKLHRQDVSVSYSDDDSRTEDSVLNSSADLEDDCKHRRARSPTRVDANGGKKRVRKSSSKREDSRDSPRRHRKKKRSKQNDGVEAKKKVHKLKRGNDRTRRGASVDSISSDSWSCSTCGSGGSSVDGEFEGSRGRSKRREKSRKSLRERSTEKGRYRYRSRSCSPCSECSGRGNHHSGERLMQENQSRRLKSVLTVANREAEAEIRDQSRDENKAEIIQAFDDFPRSRSDDSYDGGRKESSHQTHVSCEERWVDDGKIEEAYTQKIKENAVAFCGWSDPTTDAVGSTKMEVRTAISTVIGSTASDDLESILRQKALENLKKFRGGLQVNVKAPGDQKKGEGEDNIKQPSTVKAESIKKEFQKSEREDIVKQPSTLKDESIKKEPHMEAQKLERGNIVKLPSTVKAESVIKEPYKEVCSGVRAKQIVAPHKEADSGVTTAKPAVKAESVIKQPHKEVGSGVSRAKQIVAPHKEAGSGVTKAKLVVAPNVTNIATPTLEKNHARYSQNHGQIPDVNSKRLDSSAKLLVEGKFPSDRMVANKDLKEYNTKFSVGNKYGRSNPTFRQESCPSQIIKQVPASHDFPDRKLEEAKDTEKSEIAVGSSNTHDEDKGSGSTAPKAFPRVTSVSGDQVVSEPVAAAKGSSEFEQKTMSVVRGGERVQVSYKVYIPKRPPGLARRPLNR